VKGAYFKTTYKNYPQGTEKNYEKLQSESKPGFSEHEAAALTATQVQDRCS
jgi:hypothetical protein